MVLPRALKTVHRQIFPILCLLLFCLAACTTPTETLALVHVSVTADGQSQSLSIPPGNTVLDAVTRAGFTVGNLDRSNGRSDETSRKN